MRFYTTRVALTASFQAATLRTGLYRTVGTMGASTSMPAMKDYTWVVPGSEDAERGTIQSACALYLVSALIAASHCFARY